MSEQLDLIAKNLKTITDNTDHLRAEIVKGEAAVKAMQKTQGETTEKVDKINEDLTKALELNDRLTKSEAALKRISDLADQSVATATKSNLRLLAPVKEYAEKLFAYMRSQDPAAGSGLTQLAEKAYAAATTKAMSAGSLPGGGFMLPPDTRGRMIERLWETSEMRTVASVLKIGTEAVRGISNVSSATCTWAAEADAVATNTTPTLMRWKIETHIMRCLLYASQEWLEDAEGDPEAWLINEAAKVMARTENTAFILGTGVGQPRGILNYPAGTNLALGQIEQIPLGGASTLTADGLVDLQGSLIGGYKRNAKWGFSRRTHATVRKLKDGENRFYWQPSLALGAPPTLLGDPIVEFNDMPDVAADALALLYGDFAEAYTIADRLDTTVIRDPLSVLPDTRFYLRRRVGGGVNNFQAVKIGKVAAS